MVKSEEVQEEANKDSKSESAATSTATVDVKMEDEAEEEEKKESTSNADNDKEDEPMSPSTKKNHKSNTKSKTKQKKTKNNKSTVKLEEEEEEDDEVKEETTSKEDKTSSSPEKKTKTKAEKPKKSKVKPELQDKILAYMGQELQVNDRPEVTKQEVAEGCGYAKAGVHNFFYSWQDMQKEKKWIERSSAKGCFRLTQLGRDNIPQGVILVAKRHDNAGKQEYYLKALCKQCKEAKEDKSSIMFEILKDGAWHDLDEFTEATGYKNLKSKGLGYAFTHMEKKMKILEKNSETKQYRFTDKCFPEGRP